MGRREDNKLEKRARLRDAAEKLFRRRGYDTTTTREIAEEAEIAAGTLFLYAADKQDLLFLVMHEHLRVAAEDAFDTLPRTRKLLPQLRHVFSKLFAMYGRHEALARPFVASFPGASGPNALEVNALTFAFLQRLATLVEAAQQRGEVRDDVEPLAIANISFELYFTALIRWLSGLATVEQLPDVLTRSLQLLFEGIRAR
ncbi:MAG: TetR/AcrR family transcriptional regulator [Archangium sp.]